MPNLFYVFILLWWILKSGLGFSECSRFSGENLYFGEEIFFATVNSGWEIRGPEFSYLWKVQWMTL